MRVIRLYFVSLLAILYLLYIYLYCCWISSVLYTKSWCSRACKPMSSWHDIATAGSTVVSCFVSKRIKRLRRYAGERTAALKKKKKNIVHKPMGGDKEGKEKKRGKTFLYFPCSVRRRNDFRMFSSCRDNRQSFPMYSLVRFFFFFCLGVLLYVRLSAVGNSD